MDEQELLKERFKSAVSSTVKAISENFDLKIQFGGSQSSKENSLSLPEIALTVDETADLNLSFKSSCSSILGAYILILIVDSGKSSPKHLW